MKAGATFGVVYISTGKKYIEEAIRSVESLKKFMPECVSVMWCDQKSVSYFEGNFDRVHLIEEPEFSFVDKVRVLSEFSFEHTLFVDTDTVFLESVSELSGVLEKFDLACCHAPYRVSPGENNKVAVPEYYPEMNTGVILFRKCPSVEALFKDWLRIYVESLASEMPHSHDQPSFRRALYSSEVNHYVLPPEYNLRVVQPAFKGGGVRAKILHGRGMALDRAIEEFESSTDIFAGNLARQLVPEKRRRRWFS